MFPEDVSAHHFDKICAWVRSWFHVLPLDEAVCRLQANSLPSRAMSITFDDGYADNEEIAAPILARYGLTATFFVAVGYIGGGRMWNDTLIESIRRAPSTSIDFDNIDGLSALGRLSLVDVTERRAAAVAVIDAVKYLPSGRRDELAQQVARRSGACLPDDLMMSPAQVRSLRTFG
ncbi:MAG: polysaccharide deacetylase family protein, partial [Azoarcus sp.]|nr:polysaccharide deacetylase family protein [Azoarcus sp.]